VSAVLSPLLIGTVLALGALAYVLFPIFDDTPPAGDAAPRRDQAPRRAATGGAIDALREIEFDRETGKLSDDDYASLKATYTEEALAAMRAESATEAQRAQWARSDQAPDTDIDPAEAVIRRYRLPSRSCVNCGPRPEPDAVYCSTCGAYLASRCESCGAAVTEPGARFCPSCGHSLAAA
jgi:hypothetical protein